jgi:hypothetical protein
VSLPLPAQSSRSLQEGDAAARIDYAAARHEIEKFEATLNEVIGSSFSSSSFALVHRPKGAYLQGYGATFTFLINIHRALVNTPFGEYRPYKEVTPEQKKKRIDDLKDRLIRALSDQSGSLRQLRKDDVVAIVAFMEDRNFPDEPNENKTIIISASKKDLEEAGRKDDRWRELKQRVKVIEY